MFPFIEIGNFSGVISIANAPALSSPAFDWDGSEKLKLAIDPTWGYQGAQWIPTQVYGVNWQAQRNIGPEDGPPLMADIWIDDVYFVE